MAWDFMTDPAFEREPTWMRASVREELWPLETVVDELDQAGLDRVYAPLQEQVEARGLWAAHGPPELGGQGFGQVELGPMHEILGATPWAPDAFGRQAPDSGNSEILAPAATPEQKERSLHPLLAGGLRSAFSMTEPGAGADPALLRTRAVRDGGDWLISGHKWCSSNASIADFLIVMAVTDPDARPDQRASILDEVHRQSVARQILRGYAPPPGEVPTEHGPTRRAAARETFAEILEAVTSND